MITVAHIKSVAAGECPARHNPVYIGRTRPQRRGSPLANPFTIGVHGNRAEVLRLYKQWLWSLHLVATGQLTAESSARPLAVWAALWEKAVGGPLPQSWEAVQQRAQASARECQRLLRLEQQKGRVTLLCWCAPLPCHGDIVRDFLRYLQQPEPAAALSAALLNQANGR